MVDDVDGVDRIVRVHGSADGVNSADDISRIVGVARVTSGRASL
jgi:hypothetical protein